MRPYWQSSRQVTEGLPLYGGTENKGNERVSPSTRPCLSAAVKLPTPRRLPSAPNKLPEVASRKAARAVAVETFEHPLPPPFQTHLRSEPIGMQEEARERDAP